MRPAIRPAREDDADFLAWAILISQRGHIGRGWFDVALGRSEAEALAFVRRLVLARTLSWWHASKFFVAEENGTPAATLCALPTSEGAALASTALQEVGVDMDMDGAELAAIRPRGAYVSQCWIAGDQEASLIEHGATRPDHRGRA